MRFELFFLGTSAGIPSKQRNMPCIALRFDGNVLLFDVGECCQKQLMKYKVGYGSIRNIFITHLHLDHFLGVFGLIETLRMTTDAPYEELNIYAPKGFSELLINKWDFVKIHKIKQKEIKRFRDVRVSAFRTKHKVRSYGFVIEEEDRIKFDREKAESLGIKGRMFREIEKKGELTLEGRKIYLDEISRRVKGRKIVYTGDTMYSENTVKFSKGADILIHESTFREDKEKEAKEASHSTVRDAALVAQKAEVKKLVLNHISARYKETKELEEEAKKYFKGEVIVAYDGLYLSI